MSSVDGFEASIEIIEPLKIMKTLLTLDTNQFPFWPHGCDLDMRKRIKHYNTYPRESFSSNNCFFKYKSAIKYPPVFIGCLATNWWCFSHCINFCALANNKQIRKTNILKEMNSKISHNKQAVMEKNKNHYNWCSATADKNKRFKIEYL